MKPEPKREIKCPWCKEIFSERLQVYRHLYAKECPRLNKSYELTLRRKMRKG